MICFMHSISSIRVNPVSQFRPLTFPLGIHTFVLCLCLYFCFANNIIYIIFLDSTYMHYYTIFDFLFLTLYDILYVHPHLYE